MERSHTLENWERTYPINHMKAPFEIKDISTYRSELMGCAILWIMMLHFTFTQIKPLGFISQYGFAGVEIFMLVSGLGLFFSLDKESSILTFYRRRLLRIFPTYYLLGILASIILFNDSFMDYLYRYSTIGFWTKNLYWEWYVPSIVALYLVAPSLKKMIDKRQMRLIICLAIVILAISYIVVAKEIASPKDSHFFLLYRIPTFMLGMVCAYWIKQHTSMKYFLIILLTGIPCFALLYPHHHEIYNYKYLSLVFLLPLFIVCFTILIKQARFLRPILAIIGKSSLETYLIQAILFHAIITGKLVIEPAWHDAFTITLIIISSLLGILVHWLIDKSRILRLL